MAQLVAVVVFGLAAVLLGAGVFRTSSMVRSALSLLGSMAALGALFLALEAEFLGVLQLMMMATEMAIMAIFMVMYMMDPGGLAKMEMAHQKRVAITFGVIAGLAARSWHRAGAHAPGPRPGARADDALDVDIRDNRTGHSGGDDCRHGRG